MSAIDTTLRHVPVPQVKHVMVFPIIPQDLPSFAVIPGSDGRKFTTFVSPAPVPPTPPSIPSSRPGYKTVIDPDRGTLVEVQEEDVDETLFAPQAARDDESVKPMTLEEATAAAEKATATAEKAKAAIELEKKPKIQSKLHGAWYLVPAFVLLCMGGFLTQSHLVDKSISLDTIITIGSVAIVASSIVAAIILWKSQMSQDKKKDLIGKILGTFVLALGLYFSYQYLHGPAISGLSEFKVNPIALSLCSAGVLGSIASVLIINKLRNQ